MPTESPFVDKGAFLGYSLAIIGGGMLMGVYRGLQQEKVHFNLKTHGPPMAIASKALVYGTLLCFGTFAGLTATFLATTGITSTTELANSAQRAFSTFDNENYTTEAAKKDREMIKGMTEDEEMEYLQRKYFSDVEKKAVRKGPR
jgi:hypothetical protein